METAAGAGSTRGLPPPNPDSAALGSRANTLEEHNRYNPPSTFRGDEVARQSFNARDAPNLIHIQNNDYDLPR